MNIADSIIKNKLKKVYFIWGRGKTTIANRLSEKYGFFVYSTDAARDILIRKANPIDQPYMCRDYVKEYGVKSFWALPQEVIADREKHFLEEATPMMVAELIALSSIHDVILCEGDIDYRAVMPIASHAVHLCNRGRNFDWFERPDHKDALNTIREREDMSEAEKYSVIENAYRAVAQKGDGLPDWVVSLGVKNIDWDDTTDIEETAHHVELYFGFQK